jgi:hypothetical protein
MQTTTQRISQYTIWRDDARAHTEALVRGTTSKSLPDFKFQIQQPLLRALIQRDQDSSEIGGVKIKPWPHSKALGAIVLTWLVQQALDVHRLPFMEDRLLAGHGHDVPREEVFNMISLLTPDVVAESVGELKRLYAHVQTQLKAKNVSRVALRRGVQDQGGADIFRIDAGSGTRGYAGELVVRREKAAAIGAQEIAVEMDTLNSWSDDGGYSHYPVQLQKVFDIEDVLFCSALIGGRDTDVESGEWVMINRSPTGIVTFMLEDVKVDEGKVELRALGRMRRHAPRLDTLNPQPIVIRGGLNIGKPIILQECTPLPLRATYLFKRCIAGKLIAVANFLLR